MALISSAFLVTLFVAAALATDFQNCPAESDAIAVNVPGCTTNPCVIERGQTLTATVTFSVDHEVPVLYPSLILIISGNEQNVPLSGNPCDNVPTGCPLQANSINDYTFDIEVDETGYLGNFTAQFKIEDGHDDHGPLVCVTVDGVFVEGS